MVQLAHGGVAWLICIVWLLSITPLDTVKLRSLTSNEDQGLCNVTIDGSTEDTGDSSATAIHPPPISPAREGQTLRCSYTFQGAPGQRVMLNIRDLKLGQFDTLKNRCVYGNLHIWDGLSVAGSHLHPPNTLCGYKGAMELWKFSTGRYLVVEYHVDYARLYMDFTLQYQFIDMEQEAVSYPTQLTHDMKPTENSSNLCDWTIVLEDCPGECQILSPGYPGMYPPNTECVYHVVSRSPDDTIQLHFQGFTAQNKMRSFSVRPSKHCTKDYLSVKDHSVPGSPEVARFCGDTTHDVISTGNTISLHFRSANEQTPFGYNGFHLSALGSTKEWNPSGVQVRGTLCDWDFTSLSGSVSTPEHWLPEESMCTYSFRVQPGYILGLRLNVYGLRPGCSDQILVYQEDVLKHQLCDRDLPEDKEEEALHYRASSPVVRVVYQTTKGQFQGHSHRGFWMSFQQVPGELQERQMKETNDPEQYQTSYGSSYDKSSANEMSTDCSIPVFGVILWSYRILVSGHFMQLV